jgi:hypothetical protein
MEHRCIVRMAGVESSDEWPVSRAASLLACVSRRCPFGAVRSSRLAADS